MPNAAFALLVVLAGSLAIAGPSSIMRLLLAGDPGSSLTNGGVSLRCLLVPTASDVPIHLLTFLLFAAASVGVGAGVWSLLSECRRTRRLIRTLMARQTPIPAALGRLIDGIGLNGRVDLVETREPLGFCFGLVRPRVCLTTGLLTMLAHRELEAVLRHEAYHVRNRDPVRLLVGRALVAAFFLVPCCYDLLTHYRRHVEVAADRGAVRQMGDVSSLASALDKLLEVPSAYLSSLPGMHSGSLDLRIDDLLGRPTKLSVQKMIPRLALSAVGVVLIAAPAILPLFTGEYPLISTLAASPHLIC